MNPAWKMSQAPVVSTGSGDIFHAGFISGLLQGWAIDRKSTRLNSSHRTMSYAVFCSKKKIRLLTDEYRSDLRISSHLRRSEVGGESACTPDTVTSGAHLRKRAA